MSSRIFFPHEAVPWFIKSLTGILRIQISRDLEETPCKGHWLDILYYALEGEEALACPGETVAADIPGPSLSSQAMHGAQQILGHRLGVKTPQTVLAQVDMLVFKVKKEQS